MALTITHQKVSAIPDDPDAEADGLIVSSDWNADHAVSGTLDLTTSVTGALPVANGGTGVTTLTGIVKGNGTSAFSAASAGVDYGYANIPQNSQSAAYTTVLGDAGKHIFHPSSDANARTFTIAANASVAYPIGTAISFINMTSQVVTIAITSDTLRLSPAGTTGSRSLAQYGMATAVKVGTTEWMISGTGLT